MMVEGQGQRQREGRPVRRGGLVGPIILIGAGVVFLLNNLGILDWSIWWSILGLWPLVLIAIGVDLLIGRRTVWGSLVAFILILGVLGGGFWLVYSGAIAARNLPAQEVSQELSGATAATVSLSPGAGDIRVQALTGSNNLIEARLRQVGNERFQESYSTEGGHGDFSLGTEGGMWWSPTPGGGLGAEPTWDVHLNPNVPLSIVLNLGAGTCNFQLSGMTVDNVTVDNGLGRCEITFPSQGRITGNVSGAIGETAIVIPAGMEARIEASSGLVSRQISGDFTEQQQDVYVTPGYAATGNAVELKVDQAIGILRITRASGF